TSSQTEFSVQTAPEQRAVQLPESGKVIKIAEVGGDIIDIKKMSFLACRPPEPMGALGVQQGGNRGYSGSFSFFFPPAILSPAGVRQALRGLSWRRGARDGQRARPSRQSARRPAVCRAVACVSGAGQCQRGHAFLR